MEGQGYFYLVTETNGMWYLLVRSTIWFDVWLRPKVCFNQGPLCEFF